MADRKKRINRPALGGYPWSRRYWSERPVPAAPAGTEGWERLAGPSSSQTVRQSLLGRRPFLGHEGEIGRVTDGPVRTRAVGPQDAVQRAPQALDGPPRPVVAAVGAEPHRVDLPGLEGMGEHQQLGLGVERGSLGPRGQPGGADLDHVGTAVALPSLPFF